MYVYLNSPSEVDLKRIPLLDAVSISSIKTILNTLLLDTIIIKVINCIMKVSLHNTI